MPSSVEKLKITVCMGSSCFARGNNVLINKIKEYIGKYNLENRVELCATLCQNLCREGPNIRFNDKQYRQVDEKKLESLLDEYLRNGGC